MKIKGITIVALCFFNCQSFSQSRTIPLPDHKLWERPVIVPPASQIQGVKQPVISLKGTWKITTTPPAEYWKNETDISSWKDIPVPAQADMQGIPIQAGREYVYKTRIKIPNDYTGKKILLRFEGVSGTARAYINGNFLREHFGGFNIWNCDITNFVKPGEEAWLTIAVTDPVAEKASSGFDAGGILRDVKLTAVAQDYLYRFNVETDLDDQYKNAVLKLWLGVSFNKNEKATIRLTLKDPKGNTVPITTSYYTLSKNNPETILAIPVSNPVKWDAEHPELYTLEASIMEGNTIVQSVIKKIGFREITLKEKKLFINGKEVKLRGAGRFDSDPIYGRYLSDEECWKEVKMLKEANLNFVRPSCYPAAEAYLDACDKLGLYVQVENSVTFTRSAQRDTTLTPIFMNQMAEMIETVRSRPSVIIYELANETTYGINIGKTYKYSKAEDPTRPVIYSWSQSVPPGESWPYDIFSYHYPDWDVDLGKSGVAVFNGRAARPLPTDMPVLHDEFAHGSSYYQTSLARDPGMRDFWGESLKRFWERMFTTEGCIGGAMWAIIDDNAGGAWAYEWGAIDLWRRERPEYWHFKKAYSPVRINDAPIDNPGSGKALLIPVKNWYDHTNFNELTIQWTINGQSGKLKAPAIKPHAEGVLLLPARNWKDNETLNLKFFDSYNKLIDEFNLAIAPAKMLFADLQGPMPSFRDNDKNITVTGKDFELIFSKTDGLIEKGTYKGKELIKGGPWFHLTGGEIGNWKLRQLTAKPADKDAVVVTIAGSYDSVDIVFDVTIDGSGLINTEYTLARFRVPVPGPRKIPWNNQDAGGFEEVGIYYLLTGETDKLSWKRHGLWSAYPNDHIGRNEGIAERYGTSPQKVFGKKPLAPWYQDERDFSVFGQYDIGGRGTNDFRSTKENIWYASAIASKEKIQVRIESDGSDAVRMEVEENTSRWIDNTDPAIKYTGTWEQTTDTLNFHDAKEIRSTKIDDFVEYTFTGPGIAWIGSKGRSFGTADIYIDGKIEATGVNFFNRGGGAVTRVVLFSKEGLSNSTHTIKIIARQGPQFGPQRNNNMNRPISIPLDAFKILDGKPGADIKLIINNQWNHTKMGLGNYMKDPILIGSQYRDHVSFRLMDLK